MTSPGEPSAAAPRLGYLLEESDRQMILLALARLSVARPGWLFAISLVVDKLNGRQMFEAFRTYAGPPPGFPKDAGNQFDVVRVDDAKDGDRVAILKLNAHFNLEEAMLLGAWLTVLSDPIGEESERLRKQIQK